MLTIRVEIMLLQAVGLINLWITMGRVYVVLAEELVVQK